MDKILILGAKGMLGCRLMSVFEGAAIGWDREDADVMKTEDLRLKIIDLKPTAIINCVAFNDVDGAEEKKDFAFLLNAQVPGNLAKICAELNIPLVHFSTNYVFDGKVGEYRETDIPNPKSVYAQSKYQGELEVAKNIQKYYIIRTALLFGPKGESELSKKSFVDIMLDKAGNSDSIKAVSDEVNSLTYAADLAASVAVLLHDNRAFGTYHIVNSGNASWYDFAKEIFAIIGKTVNLIPVPSTEFPRKAPRPKKSVLINTKFHELRPWQEALREFLSFTKY
jgi:dTDP-4-dehydrorhamnose reductase